MDKLNIVNPTANDLGEQLGISLERMNILSNTMDRLIKDLSADGMRIVTLPYMLQMIQEHCQDQQEFTWCTCNHMAWLHRSGRILWQ